MNVWLLLVIAVGSGLFAGKIADDKGDSFVGYFVLGFLLPVLGIVMALLIHDEEII